MTEIIQYTEELQKVLINFMLSSPDAFAISRNIIKSDYFDDRLRNGVGYILNHADKYNVLPAIEQVNASSHIEVEKFSEVADTHVEWYLETIEGFCKHKALELAILESVELLDSGRAHEIHKLITDAQSISLTRDLGLAYFDDPLSRLLHKDAVVPSLSTGMPSLDEKLGEGLTPGSLTMFAGNSGSGKSLMLQNIALNIAMNGFNVIFFSLELDQKMISDRFDAMISGFGTREIKHKINETAYAIKMRGKQAGDLRIVKLPGVGTTTNVLRAFCKEYMIKTGNKIHAFVVDYLDIMYPNQKVDIGNLFIKDKYSSEEMRGLAEELKAPCVSASQFNRSSVETDEFDHSHIAGGISKINTADNLIGINATASQKEQGLYEIQFMKTRASDGVGKKLVLGYNPTSMRISERDKIEETSNINPVKNLQKAVSTAVQDGVTYDIQTGEVLEDKPNSRPKLLEILNRTRSMNADT